ncbi:hypothetical protein RFI_19580, partial [Reticulomyxa filosa]
KDMEENVEITVKVIPILEQLGRDESFVQLMETCFVGNDDKVELLEWLNKAKERSTTTIYGIVEACMVIRAMDTVHPLLRVLEIEVFQSKEKAILFQQLKAEIGNMRDAIKLKQQEQIELERQLQDIVQMKEMELLNERMQQQQYSKNLGSRQSRSSQVQSSVQCRRVHCQCPKQHASGTNGNCQ